MEAVDEAVDDRTCQELEVADPRQDLRIDKPRPRHRSGVGRVLLHYIPDAGTDTAASNWSTIWSVVMPSDSARKLVSTR